MRIRNQTVTFTYAHADGRVIAEGNRITESFSESRYPGSNQCRHWLTKPPGKIPWQFSPNTGDVITYVTNMTQSLVDARSLNSINNARPALQWAKLPASSQFGLIQIIAELDESLLIFTKKFWKSLSYGSFTWGILPLVSDLNAILDTVRRLFSDLDGMEPYEDTVEFSDSQSVIGVGSQAYNLIGTWRLTGKVVFDITSLPAFLDFVGFHPDVSTAWDLVPLSFVVDYLIPVGSYLDQLSSSGWVSQLRFVGWETLKYQARYGYEVEVGSNVLPSNFTTLAHYAEYFQRNYLDCVLPVDRSRPLQAIEMPSLHELFNMLYIFVLQKRGL